MSPSKIWSQAFDDLPELLLASRTHCTVLILLTDRHHRAGQYCFSSDLYLNCDKKKKLTSVFSCIGIPHNEDTKYINDFIVSLLKYCVFCEDKSWGLVLMKEQ